jgi:hypothetical protein
VKVTFREHTLAPGMLPAYIQDNLMGQGMRAVRLQELAEPDRNDVTPHDVVVMRTDDFLRLVGKK